MAEQSPLYRVQFMVSGDRYEVYVKEVVQGNLWGFVEIADFVWNNHSELVIDTAEERLKSEFEGVSRTYLPMHNVLRIDAVEKRGIAKVTDMSEKVSPFPSAIYSKP